MWQSFEEYFNFSKKERKGIVMVVIIILLLIILPLFFPYISKDEIPDTTQFEKEIASLKIDSTKENISTRSTNYNEYTSPIKKEQAIKKEEFYFDPNTASENDWVKLGISKRTTQTIQNYISKGGRFYQPEDIKKIYGLNESDASRLIPYVIIKDHKSQMATYKNNYSKEKDINKYVVHPVDINIADSAAWTLLPGIGSRLSMRILNFRQKLGGFYSVKQVGETYLLPDSTFQKVKPYLILNNQELKKININEATVDKMQAHPYIDYAIANAIYQYRLQHGNYNSVEDIKKIMTVTDELYQKIAPYLAVQ